MDMYKLYIDLVKFRHNMKCILWYDVTNGTKFQNDFFRVLHALRHHI